MYCVNLVVDDTLIAENRSHHTFAKTLRLAWELLGGIPQAECCVRKGGDMVAYLHTNFRGEMDECEVYTRRQSFTLVTPINPAARMFQGVFAKGGA